MTAKSNSSLIIFRFFSQLCGLIAAALGVVAIVGWLMGWRILTGIRADYIPMAPNTALSFIVLGISLCALITEGKCGLKLSRFGSTAIFVLSLIRFTELTVNINLNVDRWIFQVPGEKLGLVPVGQMALPTTLNFLFASVALFLTSSLKKRLFVDALTRVLGGLTIFIGLAFSLGYIYGAPLLYGGTTIPMALNTAIAFFVLGSGLVINNLSHDIAERKQAAEALRKAHDELEVRVAERTAELAKANEALWAEIIERSRAGEALKVSYRFLQIAYSHTEISPLLEESVKEIKNYTGCSAVGIRILDERGNIPYQTYKGFSQSFFELESPLSIKSDKCMCINVIKGEVDPKLPFYTEGGSFYMNGTTRFLATVSEEEKGQTRNVCNQVGYESVALVPIRAENRILGLIHVADPRENMIPLESVERLEKVAMQMGAALRRVQVEEALRESEKRYRQVVENATDIIYSLDTKGNFTYGNPAGLKTTGFSLEELRRFNYLDLVIPEHRERITKVYLKQFRERQATTYVEFPFFNKSREVVWFGQNASLVIEDGKVVGFHIIARDITERKQAEEALRESVEALRAFLNANPEVSFLMDDKGTVLVANESLFKRFGKSSEEIIGSCLYDLFPEDVAKQRKPHFDKVFQTGKQVHFEDVRMDRNYETFVHPVFDKEGNVAKVAILGFDITERKKAEEALRQSEERFRQLFDEAPVGYHELDTKGRITRVNHTELEMLGYTHEEMVGKPVWEFLVDEVSPQMFAAKIAGVKSLQKGFERTYRRKDGTTVPILMEERLLLDKEGKVIGMRSTLQDITERERAEEALRSSEDKYRTILENIEDGYFEVDIAGNFTFYNDSLCKILGYSKDEMIGMNNRQYTDQENAKKLFQTFNKVYRTGESTKEFDWEIIRKDGTKRNIEASVSLIKDPSGNRIGFRGLVRDITERKHAENEIKQLNLTNQRVLNSTDEGIYGLNTNGEITFINPAAAKMLGYDIKELLGKRSHEVLHYARSDGSSYKIEDCPLYKTIKDGIGHQELEDIFWRKDGTGIPVEYKSTPIKEGGKLVGAVVAFSNITERKQMEEKVRESEEHYRQLVNISPDGIALTDQQGRLTFASPRIYSIFGIPTGVSVIGAPVSEWVCPEQRDIAIDRIRKLFVNEIPPSPFEYKLLKHDRTPFQGELSSRLLVDAQGQIKGIMTIIRDITERKRAEEEKVALQEQLRQSQKIEGIGRLAGGIAHDFNNLLTVIKGYSQLSLNEIRENDPLREGIEEIRKAADRAADLTRQLLAFSRRQILEMKVLDLNDVLVNLDKMLHRLIGEDIELVTVFTDDLGRVKTDPGWVEQIIMNLAVNARDAMPNGGKLTIETANVELDEHYARAHVAVTPGRYVMLSVSDTGVGMAPEVRQQVFEPFFTTKEKGKGTGLGLSTVYGIVKQSGGNIWVYSEPGQGTTLKIYLPRVDEPLEELKERVVKEDLPRGSETILVVEDEEEVRKLAVRILKRQGYSVLDAPDGDCALVICEERKEPIHLILTDVVMPGMSGRQLADRLASFHPEMKVLYMSGYTDNAITHHGVLEKGMNYIQKPFTVDGLIRKVREVLDNDSKPAA